MVGENWSQTALGFITPFCSEMLERKEENRRWVEGGADIVLTYSVYIVIALIPVCYCTKHTD